MSPLLVAAIVCGGTGALLLMTNGMDDMNDKRRRRRKRGRRSPVVELPGQPSAEASKRRHLRLITSEPGDATVHPFRPKQTDADEPRGSDAA